jgi:hypothetical protein
MLDTPKDTLILTDQACVVMNTWYGTNNHGHQQDFFLLRGVGSVGARNKLLENISMFFLKKLLEHFCIHNRRIKYFFKNSSDFGNNIWYVFFPL